MTVLTISTLFRPTAVFESVASDPPTFLAMLVRELWWLALIPPIFAFVGAYHFGWRVGAADPIILSTERLLLVSALYFAALFGGIVVLGLISRWMAPTYGATTNLGAHIAAISTSATPLVLGSTAHLFPHVVVNTLAFIPMLLWSMWLLYRGLPIVLKMNPQRAMLMASSLIGVVLIAAVSLLGVSVAFWSLGAGPNIGV